MILLKNKSLDVNLKVKDKLIGVMKVNGVDYISLTDLALYKNHSNSLNVINKWMTNKNSFSFYSLWEEIFNSNFNSAEFRRIKNEVGYNVFTMSPTQRKKEQMQLVYYQVVEDIVKDVFHILILHCL